MVASESDPEALGDTSSPRTSDVTGRFMSETRDDLLQAEEVNVTCTRCGVLFAGSLKTVQDFQAAQEAGTSVKYRCIRCRNCTDCRNASETERVSLREEIEDQAVKDSVVIDWAKKKIVCSLPLRGKEEDFISRNRDEALKVLNQQCKKYHGDKATKGDHLKSIREAVQEWLRLPVE